MTDKNDKKIHAKVERSVLDDKPILKTFSLIKKFITFSCVGGECKDIYLIDEENKVLDWV